MFRLALAVLFMIQYLLYNRYTRRTSWRRASTHSRKLCQSAWSKIALRPRRSSTRFHFNKFKISYVTVTHYYYNLFVQISRQLDALSHFHFSPRPVVADTKLQTLLPTASTISSLLLEDITPVTAHAVSSSQLAPEQVSRMFAKPHNCL